MYQVTEKTERKIVDWTGKETVGNMETPSRENNCVTFWSVLFEAKVRLC